MSTAYGDVTDDLAGGDEPAGELQASQSGNGDAEDRGELSIAERVIERIAQHAVSEVDGAIAAPRRVLGVNVGDARPDAQASVQAHVDGGTATVEATISTTWPTSVRAVTDRLRQQVREDVTRLTGVEVDHIDVEVLSMSAPAPRRRRVQ